jgi:hypothetical protein
MDGVEPQSSNLMDCSVSVDNQLDSDLLTQEEKQLQHHMSHSHSIDFAQIMQQHQQLQTSTSSPSNNNTNVAAIESTPMNDMYLSIQIKALRYIDDELLRKDEFRGDMVYSCPICTGDTHVYNPAHLKPMLVNDPARLVNSYANFESVTFEYLMNHFLIVHQFKAVPLFVCAACNCVRVSLIDCVYHYMRNHFNKPITVGLCAYNIHDKIQTQLNQLGVKTMPLSSGTSGSGSSLIHGTKSSKQQQQQLHHLNASSSSCLTALPVAATKTHTIYGQGPLIYCVACNENYSNEPSFIRHSYLCHLMDPNINLNWYKVYTKATFGE